MLCLEILITTISVALAGLCDTPGRFIPISDPKSRFQGMSCDSISISLGLTLRPGQGLVRVVNESFPIPKSWDWRTVIPECKPVIRDQGRCGDCWAFAVTLPLQWRYCLLSPNHTNLELSPQYLLDCDTSCYQNQPSVCDSGCEGGFLDLAWQFLHFNGTALDSDLPYDGVQADDCPRLENARIRALDDYTLRALAVEDIQREIIQFGPVTAGMEVFSDFLTYAGGIYVQASDDAIGAHAVTLFGWGSGYWLAQNQWGLDWGEAGYFRIRMGTNEASIEEFIHAGRPNITGVVLAEITTVEAHTTLSAEAFRAFPVAWFGAVSVGLLSRAFG